MTDQTDSPASGPYAESAAAEVEIERTAADRVIFFCDAVVAIAITLLVLGLPLPHLSPRAGNGAVWHALYGLRDAYLAFLISFVVIGAHWRTHHRLYRAVIRVDQRLIALNMAWLLMIVITPYATRLLYGNGGFGVRFSVYACVQVIILLTIWLMSRHLRSAGLAGPDVRETAGSDDAIVLTAAAMFALSIPVAFVTEWAFAFWVAAALGIRWVRRVQRWTRR
jgi:uncharacterized membrane protein